MARGFLLGLWLLLPGLASVTAQTAAPAGPPLQLAITFDDLPAHGPLPPGMARPAVVASILSTLKSQPDMPPVYGFLNGFRVRDYPYQIHILEAWRAAGEPLGNHTWSHPEFDKLSPEAYERNIARNEPLLRRLAPGHPNPDWRWFRYPFLEEGNTVARREAVRRWLAGRGYRVAEVSMDFQDYLWNEPYARCAARHDDTSIQRLHDTYLATAAHEIDVYRTLAHSLYGRDVPYVLLMHIGAFDARMLPELLALYRDRGFRFVSLPDAMSDPIYAADPRVASPGGNTFNEMVSEQRHVDAPDTAEPEKLLDRLCR